MSKWIAGPDSVAWRILELETNRFVAQGLEEEHARQIAREHNAHEALIELAREYRKEMDKQRATQTIMRIDAVLAEANGKPS